MNNKFGVIAVIALLLIGGWFFLSHDKHDDHHHDHDEHGAHEIEAKEPVRADGEFTIVTSFYPLAFVAETLTEGLATVSNVSGARDPHDVQLTAQDVASMQDADLVILQGAEFEPWGDDVVDQLKDARVPVLVATHDLELMEGGHDDHGDEHEEGHDDEEHEEDEHEDEEEHHDEDEHEDEHEEGHDEHDHGEYDPHTWLDPVLFAASVEEMVEALETLDPENAATYEERGEALLNELATIDTEYKTALATCSAEEVITSHDAFGYVGERYDFEIHSIGGLSTQDTPSAQTLAELSEETDEGITAILLEENSISAYGETLAAETGLRSLPINPIAYVVPEGENYFSIMRTNLNTFADALQCN